MKVVGWIVLALAALAIVGTGGIIAYRAYWRHRLTQEWRITTPNGIDLARFAKVNGRDEWITVRGEDRANPVILFLHGGPSEANSPFVGLYRPFEKDFVFAQWDQPGAGMTYMRAGKDQPKLTLDSMADDGIAVAERLRRGARRPKIILIGQDWGGLLGLRMIEKRPDLFEAFVGTGQIVSWLGEQQPQYEYAKSRAAAARDQKTLDGLAKIGPPPYRSLKAYRRFGDYFEPYKPLQDQQSEQTLRIALARSPRLTFPEVFKWVKALRSGEEELTPVMMAADLRKGPSRFDVPIFFIQGADDIITPTSLVSEYVANVQAPAKRVDAVPGAAHMVMWQHPTEFISLLKQDLQSIPATGPAP
jgi:pimeloyl-ACP methyl ester carboxylesterase